MARGTAEVTSILADTPTMGFVQAFILLVDIVNISEPVSVFLRMNR